jgi:hypothetical protein
MQLRYAWRLTGVLTVAGVLLATVVGPAQAGGIRQGDPVSVAFPDIKVPVGGTAVDLLGPSLWSTGPTKLTAAKVTYDWGGRAEVQLTPTREGGECVRPKPTRLVCSDPRVLTFEGETIEQYLPVVVKAARTADPGDTVTVTITFSAKGLAPIAGTSEVHIVDGAELAVTGPTAGSLGGIGLLVIGGGVLGVLAARRRRPRFVA